MPLPADIIAALPENYRADPIVTGAADVASVVKMAIDGQRELGSRIRVPGKDAKPEDRVAFQKDLMSKVPGLTLIPAADAPDEARNAFYEALGRPKESKLYAIDKIALPPELPKDFKIPQAQLEAFQTFAHTNGYSQKQFEGAVAHELGLLAKQYKGSQDALAARNAKLKEAFGAAEDAKRNAALRAAEKFGGPEFKARLEAEGSPEDWASWAQVGETFAERGGLELTNQGPATGALSPADATRRMDEVWANKDHAYHNPTKPGHQDAVFEMFNLQRQKMGQRALSRADFDAQLGRHRGKFNSTALGATVAEVGGR